MGNSIQTRTCVGLVALVLACGLFVSPNAVAEPGAPVRFTFDYDAVDLGDEGGRRAVTNRLLAEAGEQCRSEQGGSKSLAEFGRCRADLVRAVEEAMASRPDGRAGGCVMVALADVRSAPQPCARVQLAMGVDLIARAY